MSDSSLTQPGGRAIHFGLWALQALLAAAFVAAGGAKLAGVAQMVALFEQIGIGQWFRYVTGAIEVAAGAALLVPRLVPYAAAVLTLTMVGAIGTHVFLIGGSAAPAVLLAVLSGLLAYGRRARI